jgi:hypothetical protein
VFERDKAAIAAEMAGLKSLPALQTIRRSSKRIGCKSIRRTRFVVLQPKSHRFRERETSLELAKDATWRGKQILAQAP